MPTDRFPNLPSDELAMLATVEAASNAGQYTIIPDPPPTIEARARLRALQLLESKGWIKGGIFDVEWLFWTPKTKVFHADGLASRMPL